MGKDKVTVSKWCTNTCQPDLGNLIKIAKLLEVEVADLLRKDNIDWQQDNEIEKEYDEEGISSTV